MGFSSWALAGWLVCELHAAVHQFLGFAERVSAFLSFFLSIFFFGFFPVYFFVRLPSAKSYLPQGQEGGPWHLGPDPLGLKQAMTLPRTYMAAVVTRNASHGRPRAVPLGGERMYVDT